MTEPIGQRLAAGTSAARRLAPAQRTLPWPTANLPTTSRTSKHAGQQSRESDDDRRKREAEEKQEQRRRRVRPYVRLGMAIVLALMIGGGLWYWEATKNIETTDDAYTPMAAR